MVTTPDTSRSSARPLVPEAEEFLARRRSIIGWCDRHLMTVHALSTLMLDDPFVVEAALAELLAEPAGPPPAFDGAAPDLAALAPPRARPQRAPIRALPPRDQCPDDASSPLDRIELTLALIGDRTCATVSRTYGLPEHTITARLRAGLWVLFAPCEGDAR